MVEETNPQDFVGHRIDQRGKVGTIRFIGKLLNNPKAGNDLWLGVEWDEPGTGKHNGRVDENQYFE